ncbi:hypothetical protein Bca52824_011701 [Brassica carinata]|uniref:Uncharacterized protein n=1 Tax=Brassica carinata TaxID=52824 RepID=A0A8X8B1P3_BRACI|nr:hypothetical protein Bca52824_011701 [Brassica carinata]
MLWRPPFQILINTLLVIYLIPKERATSRLARFISEVAPRQFVTVIRRHRAAKQKQDKDCFSGAMMMMSNKMTSSHHHTYSSSSSNSRFT